MLRNYEIARSNIFPVLCVLRHHVIAYPVPCCHNVPPMQGQLLKLVWLLQTNMYDRLGVQLALYAGSAGIAFCVFVVDVRSNREPASSNVFVKRHGISDSDSVDKRRAGQLRMQAQT